MTDDGGQPMSANTRYRVVEPTYREDCSAPAGDSSHTTHSMFPSILSCGGAVGLLPCPHLPGRCAFHADSNAMPRKTHSSRSDQPSISFLNPCQPPSLPELVSSSSFPPPQNGACRPGCARAASSARCRSQRGQGLGLRPLFALWGCEIVLACVCGF
jgi:hypothetical protein